jgi:hypothetical protein
VPDVELDVSRPWTAAVAASAPVLGALEPRAMLTQAALARGVATESGWPVRFVAEDDEATTAYEAHIAATGRVRTRRNAHDLLNALVWLSFPRAKARLNALQAAVLARDGVTGRRGALRDAATVFDENGALLIGMEEELAALVRARDWHSAFIARRDAWERVRVLCFGHALLEKLISPYKAITAHMLALRLPADSSLSAIDSAVTQRLDQGFTIAALSPLPLLGVPGWWAANESAAFYEDTSVFRPAGSAAAAVKCGRRADLAEATGRGR